MIVKYPFIYLITDLVGEDLWDLREKYKDIFNIESISVMDTQNFFSTTYARDPIVIGDDVFHLKDAIQEHLHALGSSSGFINRSFCYDNR